MGKRSRGVGGAPALARFRSGGSAAATPPPSESPPADGPMAAFASQATSSITAASSLRAQPAPASASARPACCDDGGLKVTSASPSASPAQDTGGYIMITYTYILYRLNSNSIQCSRDCYQDDTANQGNALTSASLPVTIDRLRHVVRV